MGTNPARLGSARRGPGWQISDWENIAFMVGWNWRDMADFALEHGLDYPRRVDSAKAKYCSQNVIASRDGKIITSFPKSSSLPTGVC